MTIDPEQFASEFLNGISALVLIIIGLLLTLTMILKYINHKEPIMLIMSMCGILLLSPWWGVTTAFVFGLFGLEIPDVVYFPLMLVPACFAGLLWTYCFTNFLYPRKQKTFLIVFTIFYATFGISIIACALIDVNGLLGYRTSYLNATFQPVGLTFLLLCINIFFVTYARFIYDAMRSDSRDIKYKGIFGLIGAIFFCIGAIIDIIAPQDIYTLIARTMLILNTLSFYFCFAMPDWLKRRLLQEK